MSRKKKEVRDNFRNAVFKRDDHKCVMCGKPAKDAHHITDRTLIPNGGYVAENGISLCEVCHLKAEEFHSTGVAAEGFAPADLYVKINSSQAMAWRASERLG